LRGSSLCNLKEFGCGLLKLLIGKQDLMLAGGAICLDAAATYGLR
jgi:hypothetical protein